MRLNMTQIFDIMHFLFGLLLMKFLIQNVSNHYLRKYKTCIVFLLRYRNMNGSLGEQHLFSSSPKLSQVFLKLNRNTKNMFFISFRKHRDEKRGSKLFTLIIKM